MPVEKLPESLRITLGLFDEDPVGIDTLGIRHKDEPYNAPTRSKVANAKDKIEQPAGLLAPARCSICRFSSKKSPGSHPGSFLCIAIIVSRA
jgi:hypothetical protein